MIKLLCTVLMGISFILSGCAVVEDNPEIASLIIEAEKAKLIEQNQDKIERVASILEVAEDVLDVVESGATPTE